ncbi:hypothetical protein GCM10023063_02070 [Arthrobacter methylotrophus]|uniref:Acyltransferase n=1 Tax=Arthrobacter methylotrophus TaxID=121291 RepID=A0ABV5ULG5_9MICC
MTDSSQRSPRTRPPQFMVLTVVLVVLAVAGLGVVIWKSGSGSHDASSASRISTDPASSGSRISTDTSPVSGAVDRSSARVTMLGDSVTLAAADALAQALPKADIQADVGRQFRDLPDGLSQLKKEGKLGDIVVVALGANGSPSSTVWSAVLSTLGDDHKLVLVTPHGNKDWIPDSIASIRQVAEKHPGRVVLADWDAAASSVSDFAKDGIHPGPKGAQVFARTVSEAIQKAAQ